MKLSLSLDGVWVLLAPDPVHCLLVTFETVSIPNEL